MTPYQLVKKVCSNYRNEKCLGVSRECFPTATIQPPGPCLIAERKRCSFFETAILPLADRPSPKNDPGFQGGVLEARNFYHRAHDVGLPKQIGSKRNCPRCGIVLDWGKKYCEPCRILRRNETQKANMQKYRT